MKDNLTLDGIRVLDLGNRASTAWCGRLLGDYGAEVIGVEEAGGHPIRQLGPFDCDGHSVTADYLLSNRAIAATVDPAALIESAHIILTSGVYGDPLGPDTLLHRNPRAIICAITPYGGVGGHAKLPGNDLTACAASGWAYVNGLQGRPPLKSSGLQASYQSGTFAFGTLIAALIEQLASGNEGQIVDISEREVLVSTSAPAPLRYQYSGFKWARKAAVDVNEGPVPVKDGWFALTISRPAFWIKAMELLGLPDLAVDKELQQAGMRQKFKERFVDRVGNAMKQWNRMDLFDALGARRVIAGPVLRMDELATNPQFEARAFFRRDKSGQRYPGPFARMSRTGFRTPEALTPKQQFESAEAVTVDPVRNGDGTTGPLAGFRGLVLTQAWAGTYATELLALLGADVIQLETRGRLDSWRGTYQNPIPKNLQAVPTARHAWNCSPLYNSVNLSKRCITVDLSEPDGVKLFKELVAHADFVAENFSPRVIGNLGIDYESLVQIKPDIIMASLSAYGAVGPWAHVPGIGGTIEPSSGMSALLGYKDEHPLNSGQMYPDPVAGLCGYSAILLALLHRDRTGEGQYIDLSMQEANFTFIGDAFLEYERTGNVRGPLGNSHRDHAPHNIYGTKGEDQWIAIAVESDAQWQTLASILQIDPLPFATASLRKAQESVLDDLIAANVANKERDALASQLARAGVFAAPVLAPDEIANDMALRERGHMQIIDHPETGPVWQSILAAKFSRTAPPAPRPAPLQGQHSLEVFKEFLGMDNATYEALCDREITGIGPSSRASVENQA